MKEGGLAVPDLKLYYKVLKTIWYWLRDRKEDQWNRLGESNSSKIIYDKPKEPGFWDKNSLFDKTAGNVESSVGENGPRPISDTLHQDKFRMSEGVKYKEGNYK